MNEDLTRNIHRIGLENPPKTLGNNFVTVKGEYEYYHYYLNKYYLRVCILQTI